MGKKFIFALFMSPFLLSEDTYSTEPFDPAVRDRQEALQGKANEANREEQIKKCQAHIEELEAFVPTLMEQLKVKLRNQYKITSKDMEGIEAIEQEIKALPAVKEFQEIIEHFKKATSNSIKTLSAIPLTELTNQNILEFTNTCDGTYSAIKQNGPQLSTLESMDLDPIITKALQKERFAYCPKGPLGEDVWATLWKNPKGTVSIREPLSKEYVNYRLKTGDEKKFPGYIQRGSWKSLYGAPLQAESYDWRTSTLACSYSYTSLGTGGNQLIFTLLATR